LVHPSVREGFLLYSRMDGRDAPHPIFADTGWPCSQRGRDPLPGGSTKQPTHWTYLGMNEQNEWKQYFWERGCSAGPFYDFGNQGVLPMDCKVLQWQRYTVFGEWRHRVGN
jgi:hypothetical protein